MKKFCSFLLLAVLTGCAMGAKDYPVKMDEVTEVKLNSIISHQVQPLKNRPYGERVAAISAQFLATPYVANTLVGSVTKPEELVANFSAVDCFTFVDYVYALANAADKESFLNNLVKTRYISEEVDFLHRKHFFTDWFAESPMNVSDITAQLTNNYTTVVKKLNQKANGDTFIPGLAIRIRKLHFIPAANVDSEVLRNIQTGDYIGIYTPIEGLDVTHVGIAIRKNGQVWYRNASSLKKNMKVVDTLLSDYIQTRPGIIVLRKY